MTARDLLIIGYGVFSFFGGLYVLSNIPLLIEHYWKQGKRKGKR